MCCDLILRRRLGKRGKRPQRAYERDGDFAGLLALDLSLDLELFPSRFEDFRAGESDGEPFDSLRFLVLRLRRLLLLELLVLLLLLGLLLLEGDLRDEDPPPRSP